MTVFVPRDRPADYAEVAARMTSVQLRRHYRASTTQIARWSAEVGRERRPSHTPDFIPMPADFPEHAGLTLEQLMEKYGRARAVLRRWRKEAGYVPGKPKAVEPAPAPCPVPVQVHGLKRMAGIGAPLPYRRDMTTAGRAAEYLQQFGAVWRCTETGKPDLNGTFWRRGHAVLTDDEIIERAEWMRSRRMAA